MSDRCWLIGRERNVIEIPKLVGRLSMSTDNNAHQFQGQQSKIKVTRPTNAKTGSASYLRTGKAYELKTWYTDEVSKNVALTHALIGWARLRLSDFGESSKL